MYYYYGFEEVHYQDKQGNDRQGFNIFISEDISSGIKPILRFNQRTRSNNFYFMSVERFRDLGLAKTISYPAKIKDILFDRFGNLQSIIFD